MRLRSIRLNNTCYKCTNDREIVICIIKKSEYSKLKLKDICEMIYMYCKKINMRIVI